MCPQFTKAAWQGSLLQLIPKECLQIHLTEGGLPGRFKELCKGQDSGEPTLCVNKSRVGYSAWRMTIVGHKVVVGGEEEARSRQK